MKKLNVIANIFFVLSLILMLLVILQNLNLIHIMPTTTLEESEKFLHYGLIANCIAYISLLISIIMYFINFEVHKTKSNCKSVNTNKLLRILKLLFRVLLIIFTLIIVFVSLLFTFLALIEIPDIPA